MFKKLLSSFALMMLLFTVGSNAQNVQTRQIDAKAYPSFAGSFVKTAITPADNEYWWGYWDGEFDNDIRLLGIGPNTAVPQKYNACLRIPAGSVVGAGKTVEGLRFTFSDVKNVANVKMWISNELPDMPDKATVCVQNVAKESLCGMMTKDNVVNDIRFENPYKIPADKDVYIGYSFEITANESQNDQYPLVVDMASYTQENAMYLKFSDTSSWSDFNGSTNGDLAMLVLLSGDIQKNSAGIAPSFDTVFGTINQEVTVPLTIDNRGTDGFESLDIVIDTDGKKETRTLQPGYRVRGINEECNFDIKLNTLSESGTSNVSITIDKVDGKPNQCEDKTINGKIITLSRQTKKKVLVEEMTAFWCGGCPIGYIALQKLRQQFGEDIVLVSLHRKDPLECSDYLDFMLESNVKGYYPTSHVDRTYMDIHPYAGSEKNGRVGKAGFGGFGLGNDCKKVMETLPVADISVRASIEGDLLTATATTKFLYSGDADHALAFVITEDGMHSEDWLQDNYLVDQKGLGWEIEEPLFDMWVNGERKIRNVIYDDIAIAAIGVEEGIKGSIPATVKEEEAMEYTVDFNLGEYFKIQERGNLNIVAFIIDKTTGRIVNADYKKVGDDTGIENIGTDSDAYEVARYTVGGRRISSPEKGVNIVKYSDGTFKKFVVR